MYFRECTTQSTKPSRLTLWYRVSWQSRGSWLIVPERFSCHCTSTRMSCMRGRILTWLHRTRAHEAWYALCARVCHAVCCSLYVVYTFVHATCHSYIAYRCAPHFHLFLSIALLLQIATFAIFHNFAFLPGPAGAYLFSLKIVLCSRWLPFFFVLCLFPGWIYPLCLSHPAHVAPPGRTTNRWFMKQW